MRLKRLLCNQRTVLTLINVLCKLHSQRGRIRFFRQRQGGRTATRTRCILSGAELLVWVHSYGNWRARGQARKRAGPIVPVVPTGSKNTITRV